MLVIAYIPHECNPDLCFECYGKGTRFVGRNMDGEWIGYVECDKCEGTGETIWVQDDHTT